MAILERGGIGGLGGSIRPRIGIPGLGILAAALVAAAALLPVAQSSDATATGEEIRQLELQRVELESRIVVGQAEVATLGSMGRIERDAREKLGMIPADRYLYISVNEPAPPLRVPLRYVEGKLPEPQPATPRPWWRGWAERIFSR